MNKMSDVPLFTLGDIAEGVQIAGITVTKKRPKEQVGGCNGCTDRESYTHVTEISLRGALFRLCPACATTIKKLL